MVNEEKKSQDEALQIDPLTDTRTVAQTPTEDEDIRPLQKTEVSGLESRTGDFDTTTGAAHPVEDSGADEGVSRGED